MLKIVMESNYRNIEFIIVEDTDRSTESNTHYYSAYVAVNRNDFFCIFDTVEDTNSYVASRSNITYQGEKLPDGVKHKFPENKYILGINNDMYYLDINTVAKMERLTEDFIDDLLDYN